MRHFFLCRAALRLTRTPLPLAGRVSARTLATALVTIPGSAHVQPPLLLRATSVAVNMRRGAASRTHRTKARGRPQNLSPGPSLLRRQALRITKIKAKEHCHPGYQWARGTGYARPQTASNLIRQ
jgi:hypothetical protein